MEQLSVPCNPIVFSNTLSVCGDGGVAAAGALLQGHSPPSRCTCPHGSRSGAGRGSARPNPLRVADPSVSLRCEKRRCMLYEHLWTHVNKSYTMLLPELFSGSSQRHPSTAQPLKGSSPPRAQGRDTPPASPPGAAQGTDEAGTAAPECTLRGRLGQKRCRAPKRQSVGWRCPPFSTREVGRRGTQRPSGT